MQFPTDIGEGMKETWDTMSENENTHMSVKCYSDTAGLEIKPIPEIYFN